MLLEPISHFVGDGTIKANGKLFKSFFPGTGEELATVTSTSADDLDQTVKIAKKAGREWARKSGAERARVLTRIAETLRRENDRLARLETLDTGKPISESLSVDIASAAEVFEYFAGHAAVMQGEHVALPGAMAITTREPLGVVGSIGAWNYPLQIAAWKSAPALATGNSVIFKPSELTPLSAPELARICLEAGLPPGVFNVVQGDSGVGSMMVSHPGIAKISLTGSVATGKKVAALAAATLKKVSLELGGKSPLIIFDDADVNEAVKGAMLANVFTQGEVCSNGTRVFVQRRIADEFTHLLVSKIRSLKIGHPLDPATQIGALISGEHRAKVEHYIKLGEKEGARLLTGGRIPKWGPSEEILAGGYYLEPAVFAECRDSMTIVQEEIFGPVISILTFDDEKEVVERANSTPFGLAAGIFTSDVTRGLKLSRELEAGVVWINNYNVTPVEVPFGGTKWSGQGRENGHAAIHDYTQVKTLYVELSKIASPYD